MLLEENAGAGYRYQAAERVELGRLQDSSFVGLFDFALAVEVDSRCFLAERVLDFHEAVDGVVAELGTVTSFVDLGCLVDAVVLDLLNLTVGVGHFDHAPSFVHFERRGIAAGVVLGARSRRVEVEDLRRRQGTAAGDGLVDLGAGEAAEVVVVNRVGRFLLLISSSLLPSPS